MVEKIDSTLLGLSNRVEIVKTGRRQFQIIKNRNSRIVMKDGMVIVEQTKKIREQFGAVEVTLKTNAPVCSKTVAFLENHGICLG